MEVKTEQKNITILAADINLKAQIPYFDAPKVGEPNDGSNRNPPGYQVVEQVSVIDNIALTEGSVDDDGTTWV